MNQNPSEENQTKKRRRFTLIYWLFCLVILSLIALIWFTFLQYRVFTNDAYVEGNQVYITPLVSGFVTAIHTDDTYLVNEGELLIQLDETDASIALEKGKKELAKIVRQVCQAYHEVFVYAAEIEVIKAELIKAAQDYQHRADVLEVEGVSIEDFEHATAALRANYYALKNKEALFKKALAFVQGTSIKNHPWVQSAADHVRKTWVELYRCKIYSPVTGLAAQRKIQVGMRVKEGDPLLSIIPLNQIWVNANFKETQLKDVRIGQKANITSDLYGDEVVFHGTVVGLPGGAGNVFSLLPPQNLSGNWIKIVQRLPVRVALDEKELITHPLRIGLSMEVMVDLRDQGGIFLPTSSKGSPLYTTTIFEKEELGNREVIDTIITENLDPTLKEYIEHPPHFLILDLDFTVKQILSTLQIAFEQIKN